jgi:hypothetical protein
MQNKESNIRKKLNEGSDSNMGRQKQRIGLPNIEQQNNYNLSFFSTM